MSTRCLLRIMLCVLLARLHLHAATPTPILPSADAVIKKMLARAKEEEKNDDAFRQRYAWYRVRTIQEFNSKGQVTRTNQFKQDFYPRAAAHTASESTPA